jgi:hypothetical protein
VPVEFQVPVALQTWTEVPEHWTEPGAQAPEHAPETHAVATQRTGSPHEPVLLQVCTPLPEHWVEAGAHEPEHWPLLQRVLAQALVALQVPDAVQV